MRQYYVYIVASQTRVIYVGMTNDLLRRMRDHRSGAIEGFTKRYRTTRLVYFEVTRNAYSAIVREKQIKGWRRDRKLRLIEQTNPAWVDLSLEW